MLVIHFFGLAAGNLPAAFFVDMFTTQKTILLS